VKAAKCREALKRAAVALVQRGMSPWEAAKVLGVSYSTVKRYIASQRAAAQQQPPAGQPPAAAGVPAAPAEPQQPPPPLLENQWVAFLRRRG
jgi:transposase